MNRSDKIERWRNQTLVNRTKDDFSIAREYYTLVNFIIENYNQRMETIQNPLLHLISHCMELKYKDVLLFAIQRSYIKEDLENTRKGHNMQRLCEIFISLCEKVSQEPSCTDEDKDLIANQIIPNHKKLVSILKSDTTTYRYSARYNGKGDIGGKGNPFVNDEESPNIQDVYSLLEDCYSSTTYLLYILEVLFEENMIGFNNVKDSLTNSK